jgi:hypothetical protein
MHDLIAKVFKYAFSQPSDNTSKLSECQPNKRLTDKKELRSVKRLCYIYKVLCVVLVLWFNKNDDLKIVYSAKV